jgi:hypothetical protein
MMEGILEEVDDGVGSPSQSSGKKQAGVVAVAGEKQQRELQLNFTLTDDQVGPVSREARATSSVMPDNSGEWEHWIRLDSRSQEGCTGISNLCLLSPDLPVFEDNDG